MSPVAKIYAPTPEIPRAHFGTPSGSVSLEGEGVVCHGNARRWVDLRSSPLSMPHNLPRSPQLETVANDGSTGTDTAVKFSGDAVMQVASYTNFDSTDEYTVEMWVKPDRVRRGTLFYKSGFIEISVAYGNLKIQVDNSWTMNAPNALQVNSIQHVVVTIDWDTDRSYVTVYINGQDIASEELNGYQLAANTKDIFVGSRNASGANTFEGTIDNIITYNKCLTEDQVNERYNEGAGTTDLPTGITEATDVTSRFDFDEGSGSTVDNNCTLGAGKDGTLSGATYSWVEGLLGITSGSVGVMALAFPPNKVTEFIGSFQLGHEWVEGSLVYPHCHWMSPDTSAGNLVWKFEYLWVNMLEGFTGNTTMVSTVVANDTSELHKHMVTNVPSGGVSGAGKKISSIIQYRFFRDGTDNDDTYNEKVWLSEFDLHILVSDLGSTQVTMK